METKGKQLFGLVIGLLLSAVSSSAAVIVYFEQVGDDVVATWTGRLDPGEWIGEMDSEVNLDVDLTHTWDSDRLYGFAGDHHYDVYELGQFEVTSLGGPLSGHSEMVRPYHFGFTNDHFFYLSEADGVDSHVGGIDFESSPHKFITMNQTLADVGAEAFDDTLAWTSSSGDAISYTTVAPIPEPSSLVLFGLGTLGLVFRRRR